MRGALRSAAATGCSKSSSTPDEISVASGAESVAEQPFPVVSCGVRLEKTPEKIVSLSPAATEIICELGFKDKLVGISDYCDYPEGLKADKVGSTENPDTDAIVKLKPDAVFTLSALSERETYALNQANIAVLTAQPPHNLEEYSALYKEIAAAFYGKETDGSEKDVQKAVKIGSEARSALEKAAQSVKLESFVYVTEKLTAAGKDTFESAVLSLSGKNVCEGTDYAALDTIKSAPKFIIAANSLSEDKLKENETLAAFIEKGAQIEFINAAAFERPTARTAEVFNELLSGEVSAVSAVTSE